MDIAVLRPGRIAAGRHPIPNTCSNLRLGIDLKYENLSSLTLLDDNVQYKGQIKGELSLADFSSIVPILKGFTSPFELLWSFNGKGKQIEFPQFSLTDNKHINLQALATLKNWNQIEKSDLYGQISQFHINQDGIIYLLSNLTGSVPSNIRNLQHIDFKGVIKGSSPDLSVKGMFQTGVGNIETDVIMFVDNEKNRSYSGSLTSHNLNLGTLLADDNKYGIIDFNVVLKGLNYQGKYPESSIHGIISSLEYCNYRYENITLDGLYKNGGFNGTLALNDDNGSIKIDGDFNLAHSIPTINIQAIVKNVKPNELNLSDKYNDSDISLKLTADFTGNSIDNLNGKILLDSLIINSPNAPTYLLDNLTISANQINNGEKQLSISSPFMNALIQGNYTYQTIPASILRGIQKHIPSLVLTNDNRKLLNNNFKFDICIENSEFFEKIFHFPMQVHIPFKLKGYLDDINEQMNLEGYIPQITYNGTLYESARLYCNNSNERLNCLLRGSMLMKSGAMLNLSLTANAKEDKLTTNLNWGNNTDVTYGGRFETNTQFSRTEDNTPKIDIEILPTNMVLNDTLWNIHPSHIGIDSGFVTIDNFRIGRTNQHLCIDGKISNRDMDSCLIDLNNINVKYVLDILSFDDVEFGGMATGLVNLKHILKEPDMQTQLQVKNFTLNKALLGDADISGYWDNELGGIRLEAQMEEKGIS